jgi:chromosome segregation ATPase
MARTKVTVRKQEPELLPIHSTIGRICAAEAEFESAMTHREEELLTLESQVAALNAQINTLQETRKNLKRTYDEIWSLRRAWQDDLKSIRTDPEKTKARRDEMVSCEPEMILIIGEFRQKLNKQ